jgi:hypothetical protein
MFRLSYNKQNPVTDPVDELPTILPTDYRTGLESRVHESIERLRQHVNDGGRIGSTSEAGSHLQAAVALGDMAMTMGATEFMDPIATHLLEE